MGGLNGAAFSFPGGSQAQTIFSEGMNTDLAAGANFSVANRLITSANSAGNISVTFKAGPSGSFTIHAAYYCIYLTSTGADCTATPTQLLFGGSGSVVIPSSSSTASDFAVFATAGTTVVVCYDLTVSGDVAEQSASAISSAAGFIGGNVCSSATRGISMNANQNLGVTLIQTR